ncbi:MAG: VIT domain-containing protein, partial [Candidatus Eremiobacterota bacterium]
MFDPPHEPARETEVGTGFLAALRAHHPLADPELLQTVPEHLMQRYRIMPLSLEGNTLRLWMVDPGNQVALDDVRLITGFDIEPVPAGAREMEEALGSLCQSMPPVLQAMDLDRPYPLQRLEVHAHVSGPLSSVRVSQTFGNPYAETIEAVYVFPLPVGAAVHEFRLRVADRQVEGRLQERGQAARTYEEGLSRGSRAALLEQTPNGLLVARVGNLPPGEEVEVELAYAARLEENESERVFRFPLVVAPRYRSDTAALPRSRSSPDLLLWVSLEGGTGELDCSHAHTTRAGPAGSLELEVDPGARLDRDFVLRIATPHQACLLTFDQHFMVSVMPPEVAQPVPRDVVIMLDRSGSMAGAKLAYARCAVQEFLELLHPGNRFALMAFATGLDRFEQGAMLGVEHIRDASAWLEGLRAEGGTEVLSGLEALQHYPTSDQRLLYAVLITDGQVGNEADIYRYVSHHLGACRLFTLGIDTAVHEAFLRQVARLGRGTCELLCREQDLPGALSRLARDTSAPAVTDLRLVDRGLNFLDESLAPHPIPDLFASRPAVISGRMLGHGPVELVGRKAGTREEWRVRLEPTPSRNPALGTLWALDRAGILEDRMRLEPDRSDALQREAVGLALTYRLLTPWTAFVLVDPGEAVPPGGDPTRVLQPLERPAPWHDGISAQDFRDDGDEEPSVDCLRDLVDEPPIIRVTNLILSQALLDQASHVHVEPEEKSLRVRYRVDGV